MRPARRVWQHTAYEGVPKEKRHIKATYANATPFTDGRYVVAFFGSQGLYAFDMNGRLVWKKDLGVLDVGAYDLPEYEWGTASSPIIYKDLVIVQCDTQKESFVMASDIRTGEHGVEDGAQGAAVVGHADGVRAAGRRRARAHHQRVELHPRLRSRYRRRALAARRQLEDHGADADLRRRISIIVASGRAPERPIFAIRPGGSGDITPAADAPSTTHVPWRKTGRGSYMPTPLAYQDVLYVLSNAGLFDAYRPSTGEEVYRQRIEHGGSGFSASPVAADGRIYLSSEDGDVFVIRAGRTFELLAKNPMGEPLMATPAIADGTLFVRGEKHLFAIGRRRQ